MQKSSKLGFSLIELSVVILVIGVLVTGITKGSRILSEAKLKSAQSLTINSPVVGVGGLLFWLETTLQKSLQNSSGSFQIADGDNILNWNDINPKTNNPYVATEGTMQPIYKLNGIGGLPTLFFDAALDATTGDTLTVTNDGKLNSSETTLFIVTEALQITSTWGTPFSIRGPGFTGFNIYKQNSNANWHLWSGTGAAWRQGQASIPIQFSAPIIITIEIYSNIENIYKNGNLFDGDVSTFVPAASTTNLSIGSNYSGLFFDGYISEIILFDKRLTSSDKSSVHSYLKQKYGIN
jgi:prepilin-type N-terminal cleavage/methylation domain-containing protein